MNNLLLFPEPPQRPQPPDASVRAEALDIRRSFIVQAPAGSGKTSLLIQRLLKLLADESVTTPEQVLAITFTNAATAELRDRVLRALAQARAVRAENQPGVLASLAASQSSRTGEFEALTLDLAAAVLARDAALGWQLLTHPHRLNIRTIDSVCSEIARSLPVLSGSGGRLLPTEDARPLLREAAHRTLLELGGGRPAFDAALRNLLLHRDGNLEDCEALLADMLALRDQWGELIPLREPELDDAWLDANLLPRLESALDLIIATTLERLAALFPPDLLHDLASLGGHLGHQPSTTDGPSPIACCAGIHLTPEAISADLARWRAFGELLLTADNCWRKERGLTGRNLGFEYDRKHPRHAQLVAMLDRLRDRDDLLAALIEVSELPPARYPANQWAVAKSLFRVLSHALVELQLVFVARGTCDFTELSLLAGAALRSSSGPTDLAEALGARLQHLLVDEMQDTSTGQYKLLELLTASWDGHSQTVFLVGDPYQSIYLFRQARVERFVRALEAGSLGELPLTPLALTANFRSQRTLVHQFNDDFSLIFPTAETGADGHRLDLIRAEATQPPSSAGGRVWHAHPQPPPTASEGNPLVDRASDQRRRDAAAIAAISADWLSRPLPPGREEPWKIAVLVRSRNHLAEVVPALRRNGTAFRAVDIETLRDRQEVLDLTALTRALLHPADRVAALAVLRAPWCGLPLADLHMLAGADDSSLRQHSLLRLIENRAHLLPAGSQQRLARVHAVLAAAIESRSRMTTAQLVERAWRSLGGDAPLASAELTNAQRFFELLDALEASAGRIDPTQLEDRLTQLYAETDPTAQVELLTIHKAKGLEWDLVFIPSLERRPAFSPSRLLTWSALEETVSDDGGGAAPIMLAPIAARGEEVDPLTRWLKRRHREREYAENKRLFYVACTRARHELHLFAAPTLTARGPSPGWPDSLLKAAWPAAEPHFAAVQPASQTPAVSLADDVPEETVDLAAGATEVPGELQTDGNDILIAYQAVDENLVARAYPAIQRLPLSFDPASRFSRVGMDCLPYGELTANINRSFVRSPFARPEGSFAARSFGNVVHACAELLTVRIVGGSSPASLLAELPSWSSRITALLRADGLSSTAIGRLVRETLSALENLLHDPDGQWLLAPHPGAAAEFAVTASDGGASPAQPISVRADRIFLAGAEPHATGADHLWIVDYKSASHGPAALQDFLEEQRTAYAAQLEAYARILAPARSIPLERVRLALYFPALRTAPRLVWWSMNAAAALSAAAVLTAES